MYTRFTFYRSREWTSLLQQIRAERTNDQGHVICEYCGKPILRPYDMIGHHKQELTEENVNDYTVSLNPENIALVHHRCHNYIHNKLGYTQREVFLVYGPPLAGKTSWVEAAREDGDLIIDMDNIWQSISGLPRYIKPNTLKAVAFRIRDTELDCVRYRYGRWNNAYIVGGYPNEAERARLAKELGAREVFIEATEEECLARLEEADDARGEEWRKYIAEWFREYSATQPPRLEN